jgi:hypothetical protein
MATNALAPRPQNALTRQTDPMQALLRQSAEYPQYGELVGYLSARRMMPPISMGGTGSASGLFESNSIFGSELPKTGVVKVGYNSGPSTVVHELTHAADTQISSQYYELKNKRGNLTPAERQFMQAFEKLAYNPFGRGDKALPRRALAEKLDPAWAKKHSDYRATNRELPAWGMGATVTPDDAYNRPLHLDPTMATEFSVLLDMARKLQKSQPVTDKR